MDPALVNALIEADKFVIGVADDELEQCEALYLQENALSTEPQQLAEHTGDITTDLRTRLDYIIAEKGLDSEQAYHVYECVLEVIDLDTTNDKYHDRAAFMQGLSALVDFDSSMEGAQKLAVEQIADMAFAHREAVYEKFVYGQGVDGGDLEGEIPVPENDPLRAGLEQFEAETNRLRGAAGIGTESVSYEVPIEITQMVGDARDAINQAVEIVENAWGNINPNQQQSYVGVDTQAIAAENKGNML